MAGTRLFIQTSFLLQLFVVVLIAVFYEIKNDNYQLNVNLKFFAYRSDRFLAHGGVKHLRSKIAPISDSLDNITLSISFRLIAIISRPFQQEYNESTENFLRDLSQQIENNSDAIQDNNKSSHIKVHVTETNIMSFEDLEGILNVPKKSINCENLNISNLMDINIQHQQTRNNVYEYEYPIFIALECADTSFYHTNPSNPSNNKTNGKKESEQASKSISNINVHDSGLLYIQIRFDTLESKHQSSLSYFNTINGPIAKTISQIFISPPMEVETSKSTPEFVPLKPTYHVTVTLLNQDPSHSPHHFIGTQLSNSVQTLLRPFLDRISQSQLTSFITQTRTMAYTDAQFPIATKTPIMYAGIDSSNGLANTNQNPDGFTILGSSILEWFIAHFIVSSSHRYSSSSIVNLLHSTPNPNHLVSETSATPESIVSDHLDYVAFIPSPNISPLFFLNKEVPKRKHGSRKVNIKNTGKSYYIKDIGGISIMNLYNSSEHTISYTDLKEESVMEIITNEVEHAVSSFASQIRHEIGLSFIPPHQQQQQHEHPSVNINYIFTENGATKWEIEKMVRCWLPIKFRLVLENAKNLLILLEEKSGLEIDEKLHETILDIIDLLIDAQSHLQTNNSPSQALEKINKAEQLTHAAAYKSSMMEHFHFPFEHLMAVFSPFLLPMSLPILIGIIKEWKRFKKLKNDKAKCHIEEHYE